MPKATCFSLTLDDEDASVASGVLFTYRIRSREQDMTHGYDRQFYHDHVGARLDTRLLQREASVAR